MQPNLPQSSRYPTFTLLGDLEAEALSNDCGNEGVDDRFHEHEEENRVGKIGEPQHPDVAQRVVIELDKLGAAEIDGDSGSGPLVQGDGEKTHPDRDEGHQNQDGGGKGAGDVRPNRGTSK